MAYLRGQNKKILLVYDNREYCELLEAELAGFGFDAHTSRSLQTALMMIRACNKIGTSYQWLLVHNDLRDLADAELEELHQQQHKNRFDIIYFHESLVYANVWKISNKNKHVVPFSRKTGINAFTYAIKQIISNKELLDRIGLQAINRHERPKVLLVEDNDIGRLMAKTLLESLGLEVTEANNGQEGLKALDLHHYNLILTDIFMPVMNGLDMVRTIRSSGYYQLPIIVMSANAEENWAESFFAGANGFLIKPFDVTLLQQEVNKWLPLQNPDETQSNVSRPIPTVPDLKKLEYFLDIQAGIRRSGGQTERYWSLLRHYYDEYRDISEQLAVLLHTRRRQQAIELVHNLRGAAGNLGATKIEILAGKLEHDLRHAETIPASSLLEQEHKELITALGRSVNNHSQQKALEEGSYHTLWTILQPLIPLVKGHQARLIKNYEERLATYKWPTDTRSEVHMLLTKLKGFQYDEARALLADLVERLNPASEKIES